MGSYALHRTAAAIATLAAASVIIFFFIHLIPGDPLYVLLGDTATPDQVDALRTKLGLDQPIIVQYFRWLANVARGDLGDIDLLSGAGHCSVIRDGAETSILLASITMIWITLIGVPVGVIAAMRHGSWLDQGLSGARDAVRVDPDLLGGALSDPVSSPPGSAGCQAPAIRRSSKKAGWPTCAICCCRASRWRRRTRR